MIFIFISLLVNVYPIKLLFGKRAPTIVIGTKTNEGSSDVTVVTAKAPQKDQKVPSKVLSDDQIQKLNEGELSFCPICSCKQTNKKTKTKKTNKQKANCVLRMSLVVLVV